MIILLAKIKKMFKLVKKFYVLNCIIGVSLMLPTQAYANNNVLFWDITDDSSLCGFPIRSEGYGKPNEHVVLTKDNLKKIIMTGQAQVILTNVNTGYSITLPSNSNATYSFNSNTGNQQLILRGNTVILVLAGQLIIPAKVWRGEVNIDLQTFHITKEAAMKEAVDVCRLLDLNAPAVVPRTTPAPWGIPLTINGTSDVLGV